MKITIQRENGSRDVVICPLSALSKQTLAGDICVRGIFKIREYDFNASFDSSEMEEADAFIKLSKEEISERVESKRKIWRERRQRNRDYLVELEEKILRLEKK